VNIAIGIRRPTLDTGEHPFDAQAEALNAKEVSIDRARRQDFALPLTRYFNEHRDKIFGARENEYIGLGGVFVLR
jgi:hypothetical protein